jgi:hypothetical protein
MHQKVFYFWDGTNASTTLFNLHRAKRVSDKAVLVEAPFDAMRIHQAGYPNAVAVAGGYLTQAQADLLQRHFTTTIVMPDNDPKPIIRDSCGPCRREKRAKCKGHWPGKDFAEGVEKKVSSVYWTKKIVGFKDACDMTDEQIRDAVNNAEPRWAFA